MSPDSNAGDLWCSEVGDDCTGDTVCLGAQCVAAFDRTYRLTVLAATVPATKPDGAAWDEGAVDPDVFARIVVDGAELARTETVQDSLSPTWNEYVDFTVDMGTRVTVQLVDEDLLVDDPIADCAWDLNAQQLRLRGMSCAHEMVTGLSLTARIEPRP